MKQEIINNYEDVYEIEVDENNEGFNDFLSKLDDI